jgi:hypothetical protein
MIVNRRTLIVKKECSGKVVKLLQTIKEQFSQLGTVRIYEGYISPCDQVVWEAEFESIEKYANFSAEWVASPQRAKLLEGFAALTESGGTSEIWQVTK